MAADIAPDDLRAAVGAGLLSEAQAASLSALAQARAGRRALAARQDDEPFELFRGFGEIFVALGVALLGAGVWTVALLAGPGASGPQALALVAAWALAEWLTRKRRMILPSLLLAVGVAAPAAGLGGTAALTWVLESVEPGDLGERLASGAVARETGLAAALAGAAGALAFYLRFRLPFAVFLVALGLSAAVLIATGLLDPMRLLMAGGPNTASLFDLRAEAGLAPVTLGFGLACFAAAMAFDMRDPHRVTRLSACGFWLHLIAAPAIVNTLALSAWNMPGPLGLVGAGAAAGAMALVALVIDRRSFLVASMAWMALLLGAAFRDASGPWASAATLLILGAGVTLLGAGWARARGAVMGALPGFPGKDRLPPWAGAD